MNRITHVAAPVVLIALVTACQGNAPAATAETAGPTVSGTASAAASASAERSAAASAVAASPEPMGRPALEAALTALGCSFVNEFAQGPVWSCPGTDGAYVVSLLTAGATGQVTDVVVTPDFPSELPTQEVADLLTGVLEVAAPGAASADVEAATDAISSFDPSADPVEIDVAGWTVFLAAQEDDTWSLSVSISP